MLNAYICEFNHHKHIYSVIILRLLLVSVTEIVKAEIIREYYNIKIE